MAIQTCQSSRGINLQKGLAQEFGTLVIWLGEARRYALESKPPRHCGGPESLKLVLIRTLACPPKYETFLGCWLKNIWEK